ncbi:hypothetical protein [Nocardioides aquiterrae]|uniref:Endonuclease n=1 Tax=Nocardioides aquiterrae TaxID=203799 RepID=A0ABP4EVY3_9ACTN
MNAATFTHVHASGRFDASLADVRTDWDNFRADPAVKLITATEHGSGDHDKAFDADGWKGYRGHECVVVWRIDTFEPAWEPSFGPLARKHTFNRGSNRNATTWLTTVPLRHRETGRVVMVRVCHMPASVQDGERFRASEVRKVAAWTAALARWGHRCRRFKRDHPHAAQINVADWNVDLRRRHWRALIDAAMTQRCAWGKHLPTTGSLGRRLIDGAFIRLLRVESADVMRKGKSSDHKPVRFRYQITNKGA